MTVGENIQKLRKKLGLSQEELGYKLYVSRQTVSLWEKNQTFPTVENLMRLKEIFGVSVDEILSLENKLEASINKNSMDTICASLCYALGIEPPKYATNKNPELCNYIDKVFSGKKADRLVMYNPDAVAEWVCDKYPELIKGVAKNTDCVIPLATVMPSVTPVCFATMYTGAAPEIHGIKKYEKPVLTIDTFFDALVRAGKKVALITYKECSLGLIYLGRDISYYHYPNGDISSVNAKAMELLFADEYDVIIIYNGNYDSEMHKSGPESVNSLAELRLNGHVFSILSEIIKEKWKNHNTLIGFAMDHGCHEIDGGLGSHGLDMPEDINVKHFYKGYKAEI